ncbi:MAG: cytochrome c oxidase subunit II [Microthrixaceae bacterium]
MKLLSSLPRPIRRPAQLGLGVVLAVALASCGNQETYPLTTLSPQGKQADTIHSLVKPIFVIAAIVFVLVEVFVVFIVLRYRRRRDDVDGENEPVQLHGNTPLELTWTALPALLLAGLAVFNVQTIFSLEERAPDAIEIDVYGQQWWWEYRYDLDSDGEPEIVTANEMVIPVGKPVELNIRSRDVIHSFWIPALNGKMDATPGSTHFMAMQANEPGVYEGQCTEFCGLSHGYMRMSVKALEPAEYEQWLTDQQAPPEEPTSELAQEGLTAFQSQCAYCHQVNGLTSEGTYEAEGPVADYQGLDGAAVPTVRPGVAPNLTHLMSRERFAGGMFPLYNDDDTPNEAQLKEWLTDPEAMKPMRPNNQQGMPNLNLDPATIDALVAYLVTLD